MSQTKRIDIQESKCLFGFKQFHRGDLALELLVRFDAIILLFRVWRTLDNLAKYA